MPPQPQRMPRGAVDASTAAAAAARDDVGRKLTECLIRGDDDDAADPLGSGRRRNRNAAEPEVLLLFVKEEFNCLT